jgi:hypothetical protein
MKNQKMRLVYPAKPHQESIRLLRQLQDKPTELLRR